jgi:hypothetical protein
VVQKSTGKISKPIFEIKFSGPDVRSENIRLADLSTAFIAVKSLATGLPLDSEVGIEIEQSHHLPKHAEEISLLPSNRGTTEYLFVGGNRNQAIQSLAEVGKILQDPNLIGERDSIFAPVEHLSNIAKNYSCVITVSEVSRARQTLATIHQDSYRALCDQLFIKGGTSITGRVERVGGSVEMNCALRVDFQQKLLICEVASTSVLAALGANIHQEVMVEGQATWFKNNFKILRFSIENASAKKRRDIVEALEELRTLTGPVWESLPPVKEYLAQVYSE